MQLQLLDQIISSRENRVCNELKVQIHFLVGTPLN